MQKTFEVAQPIQLDVSLAAGEVEIDATADGRAEIELIAHDEESQQFVDAARVELRGSRLLVDVAQRGGGSGLGRPFGGGGITCRVHCPEGSSVRARTKSADLTVNGLVAELDASAASGDIKAGDVTGDARCRTASGDVFVGDLGGRASVDTASGDVTLGHVRGAVSANSASGNLRIAAADGDAKAATASGDVVVGAVSRGDVGVNSASGDVQIGIRRGSRAYLDCSTVSGDTRSELELTDEEPVGDGPLVSVKVRTASGDIRILRAPASTGKPSG